MNIHTIDNKDCRYTITMNETITRYKLLIRDKWWDIMEQEITNNNLSKIFEWYSCIKLMQKYERLFLEYSDIDIDFKENNNMSKSDTGIDCCDMIDTIVQCKLRKKTLTWKECSTFFASQNAFINNKLIIKWPNLIITRNSCCTLSKNLKEKMLLFEDVKYDKTTLINYCNELLDFEYIEPTKTFSDREYQNECIVLIHSTNNLVLNLPTGTGKNYIMIKSFKQDEKYLILVPRIILMHQIYNEICEIWPSYKNKIQLCGNGYDYQTTNKNIVICVYNSINKINNINFDRIFIDEG